MVFNVSSYKARVSCNMQSRCDTNKNWGHFFNLGAKSWSKSRDVLPRVIISYNIIVGEQIIIIII